MKQWMIIFFILGASVHVCAQNWCDSTLTICDSVSIDSIFFTHTFGDRVHITMTINHEHLYAPTLVLCPSDEDLLLERNNYPYFSLFGPSTVMPFYEFLNFSAIGDTLAGQIILDNSNNTFPSCLVNFQTPVTQGTTSVADNQNIEVKVFPNPVDEYLYYKFPDPVHNLKQVYLVSILGDNINIPAGAEQLYVGNIPSGFYVVVFEFLSGNTETHKIFIPER